MEALLTMNLFFSQVASYMRQAIGLATCFVYTVVSTFGFTEKYNSLKAKSTDHVLVTCVTYTLIATYYYDIAIFAFSQRRRAKWLKTPPTRDSVLLVTSPAKMNILFIILLLTIYVNE